MGTFLHGGKKKILSRINVMNLLRVQKKYQNFLTLCDKPQLHTNVYCEESHRAESEQPLKTILNQAENVLPAHSREPHAAVVSAVKHKGGSVSLLLVHEKCVETTETDIFSCTTDGTHASRCGGYLDVMSHSVQAETA
jgi:hypothetical protein